MRIGIFFGGSSREREVSFAGGRTVFDNLDKSLFSAVPIFIDPFQNVCLLNWEYIYKGSIRDFYDPDTIDYQDIRSKSDSSHLLEKIGTLIPLERLSEYIDFAFLCLHGINGEDGRIQGLLEWLQIPYSGSGIISSALGMDKAIQKEWMIKSNFPSPPSIILKSEDWGHIEKEDFYTECKNLVGLPLVIKASHQGSSIGVHILRKDSLEDFVNKIEKTLFIETVHSKDWNSFDKNEIVRHLLDFREGPGLPAELEGEIIYRRTELVSRLDHLFSVENKRSVSIKGLDSENKILIEGYIEGKEFSCIVIENLDGSPMALPPTEIKKPEEVFTYRSKYLPGLSNKITPIEENRSTIESISKTCEKLFVEFGFNVYARLDGFLSKSGIIYLNDPNTTSGMMPSSFFFHQAAEIGLNPSQFLTYIIYTSIKSRMRLSTRIHQFSDILIHFNQKLNQAQKENSKKVKVGILLGGYSSERHISVESGRNIYEKFASSTQYEPIPLFLTGESGNYQFYKIPINVLLKDNADDIRHKILSFHPDDFILSVIEKANGIIEMFSDRENLASPQLWDYEKMAKELDFVFIALHGRPGEDGEIQIHLEEMGIPYNGSGIESSRLTIDKYLTNEVLAKNGVLVPKHYLLSQAEWLKNQDQVLGKLHKEFPFPFIAKPSDDGCSSAVIKIKSDREFLAYVELLFRNQKELPDSSVHVLSLNPKEEFPIKKVIFIEELIGKNNADYFMEITGGLFTELDSKGDIIYHMLDPSEALAGKDILSLEEKFLAGEGQNITPPRFSKNPNLQKLISDKVKNELEKTARILGIIGYCRIDAFVRIYNPDKVELIVIEANSLPGMTPATAIFHQAALSGLKPFDFIQKIVEFGQLRNYSKTN